MAYDTRLVLVAGALTGLTQLASADVFLEVTRFNEAPNGVTEVDTDIGTFEAINVWMWATPDDALVSFVGFDLNSTYTFPDGPAGSGLGQFTSVGTADPDGLFFSVMTSPGAANPDRSIIAGIEMQAVPHSFVQLGSSPTQAIRLYANSRAAPLTAGAFLRPDAVTVFSSVGSATVHVFGLAQSPAPATATLMLASLGLTARRRRVPRG